MAQTTIKRSMISNLNVATELLGPFTALASATTTTLASVSTIGVSVTGTVTITSFGTGVSLLRIVKFAAALTLTHNATSLILPGGASITTAAGDTAVMLSDASSNWTCVSYTKATGKAVVTAVTSSDISAAVLAALAFGPFTTIASATTTTLANTATVGADITGTTTITSFGTGANLLRIIKFSGALTLTHNATSLILPGGASITTAAGDTAIALSDGSSNWRVVSYTRASSLPVLESRSISAGGLLTGGGTMAADRTITGTGASQAEAEAGSSNTVIMTPLRTAQAISALATSGGVTLLGTLTTTSGTSQALTSIPSGYKFFVCDVIGVSSSGASNFLQLELSSTNGSAYGASGLVSGSLGVAANVATGVVCIWNVAATLVGKVSQGIISANGGAPVATIAYTPTDTAAIVNAIRFSLGGVSTFDAGSIVVYGVK